MHTVTAAGDSRAVALLLVGMSAREAAHRGALLDAARPIGAAVAFLQAADPSLSAALTDLADAGSRRIDVVGLALGPLAPGSSWLRRIAAYWWRERAEPRPDVVVADELAVDLFELTDLRRLLHPSRPVGHREAGLTSAAWDAVPAHRHQVLVCRGPRCSARGADRTHQALVLALLRKGLGDDDVLVTTTGCQYPCNHAPVVSVQPDDVWYGAVHAPAAERIAAEHLAAQRPVTDLCLPGRPRTAAPPAPPNQETPADAHRPALDL